ncbi:hypothetical protein DL546_000094 [Coniochaeta pulveracea]|uniref:DUF7707 domain-containing protein n=1 Tax=Coniochaeta pulveracea TaxID=177199 RepID=A0A420YNA4_9PEZI|nr:hypothetical protein DL546_000094 [Coniochaeta pulveracea]
MLRLSLVAVALASFSLANAQTQNFTVDPNAVDSGKKSTWCTAELNTCNTLCGNDNIGDNICDVTSLTYTCACADGTSPDLAQYKNTMPWFFCQYNFDSCIQANVGNANGQKNCTTSIQDKCGNETASKIVATTSATVAPSASNTGSAASSSGASSASATVASSSSSTAAAAPTNLAYIGNGAAVVAAGLFAALL